LLLGPVDVSELTHWINSISFEEWPQQHRLEDGQIRPSMVTDLSWHDFGAMTDGTVQHIMESFPGCVAYQRMLSVVMPGHSIPSHVDEQGKDWLCRVHVPLMSNDKSKFWVDGVPHDMAPGFAYRVDTTKPHAVTNNGDCPRIHMMFDVSGKA
jgi:hypothetical protein